MPGHVCCCTTACSDCLISHVIDSTAGCCHSSSEMLVFRIERPAWSLTIHTFGDNPISTPPECPGGCELSFTTDYAAMDPIQAVYEKERTWFRLDYTAKDSDRPDRAACGEVCADCCPPPAFPPYDGCLCDPDALLNTYQKGVMEVTPQYMWLLDSICHGGSSCFPARHDGSCTEIPGATTLYGQLIGVVHLEHWWKLSDCSGAVTPALYAPNDPGTPVSPDCIMPKRWVYACSGVPLYEFDLLDAVSQGVIDSGEFCAVMASVAAVETPSQAVLKKLWDAGYIRAKDWRPEIADGLAALQAAFPDAYALCTVPDCTDLEVVGPVRKVYWDCLDPADVADHTAALQASLGTCGSVDPWDGSYPADDTDPEWDLYQTWLRVTKATYFHARPGGWSWICVDPGVPDEDAPDIPHRYSVSCPDNGCIDVSGYPQDWSCADGTFDGVHPVSGLTTCEVGCESYSPEESYDNPYGCIFSDVSCVAALDGSSCVNVAAASSCDGIHFVHSIARAESVPIDDCHPSGVNYYRFRENHAYLFGVNRTCGDWETECYACRALAVPIAVADLLPDISQSFLAIRGLCDQLTRPECAEDETDLPCGSYCVSIEDPCVIVATASDCVAAPDYDDTREVCP